MQLLSATPDRAHQIGRLQDPDVLRSRLPRHVQVLAELAQRLPVPLVQQVEQLSACRVAQRLENLVSVHPLRSVREGNYMQVTTCMSSNAQPMPAVRRRPRT